MSPLGKRGTVQECNQTCRRMVPVASSLACIYNNFREGCLHHPHYEQLKVCRRSRTFKASSTTIDNIAATWNAVLSF